MYYDWDFLQNAQAKNTYMCSHDLFFIGMSLTRGDECETQRKRPLNEVKESH